MAAVPSIPLVPVEQYLNSSYRPDREYVDGVSRGASPAKYRPWPFAERSRFILGPTSEASPVYNTSQYPDADCRRLPLSGARPGIVSSALAEGTVVDVAPWVVIEISPTDKVSDIIGRFREFAQLGTRHILLLDPELLIAYRFEDDSLLKTNFTHLELPTGSLPFNTQALFQQFIEQLKNST